MIGGWLLKLTVVIALVAGVAVEAGSPLVARGQVDDAAHAMADESAFQLKNNRSTFEEAQASAKGVAREKGVTLVEGSFSVDTSGAVHLAAEKHAFSLLLKRFSATKGWYDIVVRVTGKPPRT